MTDTPPSDAAPSPAPAAAPSLARVLQEALSKSGMLWVGSSITEATAAWFAAADGVVFLLTGPGEQRLPALDSETLLVVRSKDSRARLLTVPAAVRTIDPSDDEWTVATAALAGARLNAGAPPAALPAIWADRGATVLVLTPDIERIDIQPDTSSGAAAPRAAAEARGR